jgi:lipopolysaccharide export LptBFGC system permease protein LptF
VDDHREKLIYPVAAVVLVAFVASLAFGFVTRDFEACFYTVPMMSAVVAYALGISAVRKNGDKP